MTVITHGIKHLGLTPYYTPVVTKSVRKRLKPKYLQIPVARKSAQEFESKAFSHCRCSREIERVRKPLTEQAIEEFFC